jgi:hypothetical protein
MKARIRFMTEVPLWLVREGEVMFPLTKCRGWVSDYICVILW